MEPIAAESDLAHLLGATRAPVYAVDERGVIVFANAALCDWVGLAAGAISGRAVEYHSETARGVHAGPLSGLCPPPAALAGQSGEGAVSTMSRDGRLRHRRAHFLALERPPAKPGESAAAHACAVLVLCDAADLSPQELAAKLSDDPSHDELHRDVRRFRRALRQQDATALLLGDSPAARKFQTQFDLAVRTRAHATVVSPCPPDADAIARAIHYADGDAQARLVPVDCLALDAPEALRVCDAALENGSADNPVTLLLSGASRASGETQAAIAARVASAARGARVLATVAHGEKPPLAGELEALVGGLRVEAPALGQRAVDLPLICQVLLERANVAAPRQVGGLTPEAIDAVALYDWPGGVAQLADAIAEAHARCDGPTITPDHLPSFVRHAALAAARAHQEPPSIVLDKLLVRIERELLERALGQADGNKAEAARLLGMTRPRLYRRLERLGLTASEDEGESAERADD